MNFRDFPGPVLKIPSFHCRGMGFTAGGGTQIPQIVWHGQKNKNNFNLRANLQMLVLFQLEVVCQLGDEVFHEESGSG